jgi:kumamolisin
MGNKISWRQFRIGCGSLFLLVSMAATGSANPLSIWDRVVIPHSISKVDFAPSKNLRSFIKRRKLSSTEDNYVLYFNISLKMRNMADLDRRIKTGERISPAEMQTTYDPTTTDYQAIVNWMTTQGFTIVHPDNSHLAVFATGTVSQIKKAFAVDFAMVSSNGSEYASAITAPSVPASLAPPILSINHLQPQLRLHPSLNPANIQSIAQPGQPGGSFTPPQVIQAYGGSTLYANGITGTGQTIAVLSGGVPIASDLTTFWSFCGINNSLRHIAFINYPEPPNSYSAPSQDTDPEDTLDVEWASGTAPGAMVRVYDGTVFNEDVLQQIYNDATNVSLNLHLNQVSTSYGLYEDDGYDTSGQEESDHQYIVLLASAGITFFCGSGDSSYSNNPSPSSNPDMFYPGADSYATCVGGTALYTDANYNVTAETPWLGTSGGASFVFPRQYWQNEYWINKSAGTDAPIGKMRLGPDVCAPGGGDDFNSAGNAVIYSSSGGLQTIIGTSWSGPTWAGFCALLNQVRANAGMPSLGLLGPYIYPMLGITSPYTNGNFRDIVPVPGTDPYGRPYTNGNRSVQSSQGYDQVTGIGVPNLATLATTLATYVPPTPTAPVLTNGPAPSSATVGTAYSFTYTNTAYPPATFTVSSGGLPPGLTLDLLSGTISGTPTKTGTYSGVVDAGNLVGTDATQNFSITVSAAAIGQSSQQTSTIVISQQKASIRH